MVDLEQTVVVTGFGEVGPYGLGDGERESPLCLLLRRLVLPSVFCLLSSAFAVLCRLPCGLLCRLSSVVCFYFRCVVCRLHSLRVHSASTDVPLVRVVFSDACALPWKH
eukprot:COSAG06_NODE_27132_length_600_cov_0.810379_2_plen_108_part_01